jgi:predicted 3-demethylubiquinone-9 3-methyltransferase (glyoxalase superfamily)
MQKISTCLWFNGNGEDAANYYMGIFKNSRVTDSMRYGDAGPGPKGSLLTITFEIEGYEIIALNGGPLFTFSPATSLFVKCDTQDEIDAYWAKLSEGGQVQQCGWVTDKFGVTWQIVPKLLGQYLKDKDPAKSTRVMQAMLRMVKLDIGLLKKAYEQT